MSKPKLKVIPIQESRTLDSEERTVSINRTAVVVKGGRRFSFSALTVVGNRSGYVGIGFGKAKEVPSAVEKSIKDGRKNLIRVARLGSSIPHQVEGRYGASLVRLVPAAPGTGIIAGGAVRQVVELSGITDILTKAYGSTNPINLTKATLVALSKLRDPKLVAEIRGVELSVRQAGTEIQEKAPQRPAPAATPAGHQQPGARS
jgi:small subunit ribosomal protein S5